MVCYALAPSDGESWLTPSEVVERLHAAFAWVDSDAQEGIVYTSRMLARMKEMRAPQALIDHLEQRYEDSIAVAVSDAVYEEEADPEHRLEFVVMPEESIRIYTERRLLCMVQRCMTALDYDMMEL